MVKACIECGCDSFVANPFKKGKCAACFHIHEEVPAGGGAAKAAPPPAATSTVVRSAGEMGGSGDTVSVRAHPGSGSTTGSPAKAPAAASRSKPPKAAAARGPPPSRAASATASKPAASRRAPPTRPSLSSRPAPSAASRKAPPTRPSSSSRPAPSAPSRPTARSAAAPAPAAAPVLPPGAFASLDDVMAHVAALKEARMGQLGHASLLLQRAMRRLLFQLRGKAQAMADIAIGGCWGLTMGTSVEELDMYLRRVAHACSGTPHRETLLPFFLEPVNAALRPGEDGAEGPPFEAPEEVHDHAENLRVARLELLHASQAAIRSAYYDFMAALEARGVALATGAAAVIVDDMAQATSAEALQRCCDRLACLRAAVPASPFAMGPFVDTVAHELPPAGDQAAADAAGVGVPPEAPLASVDDVIAYGDAVAAHRRGVLDASQRLVRDAFLGFTARLAVRGQGLAELVALRVADMHVAASDVELAALLDTVTTAIDRLPKTEPAPSTFLAHSHTHLGLDAAAELTKPYEVFEQAEAVHNQRLAELHAAAAAIAAAYRNHREEVSQVAFALAQVTSAVLYAFASAHTDYGLERQTWRLEQACGRVAVSDAQAVATYLQGVNDEYSVVQDLEAYDCPMPAFGDVDDIIRHGAALADQRLVVLNSAQEALRRAYFGYRARIGFASAAMAELVMNTIRSFESALDRELDILSTRVEAAMQRVRGHKDAERMFLEALNKYMAERA